MGDVVQLLRAGVVGAAGMLGREVVAVLERRRVPLLELVPIGSEDGLGEGIDYLGEDLPLRPPDTELVGIDRLFLCAPAEASLEYARRALHARVPTFDLSGALRRSEEVPLVDAERLSEEAAASDTAPLLSLIHI